MPPLRWCVTIVAGARKASIASVYTLAQNSRFGLSGKPRTPIRKELTLLYYYAFILDSIEYVIVSCVPFEGPEEIRKKAAAYFEMTDSAAKDIIIGGAVDGEQEKEDTVKG